MKAVIWIIGALIVIEAAIIIVRPDIYKKFIKFLTRGRMLYIPAVVAVVVGIVFLIYARECSIPWIIIVFGLIAAIKGVAIFLVKGETLKETLNWLHERSNMTLRLLGILALAIGALILYAGPR